MKDSLEIAFISTCFLLGMAVFCMALPWGFEAAAYSARQAKRYFAEPVPKLAASAEEPCLMPMVELEREEEEPQSWADYIGK